MSHLRLHFYWLYADAWFAENNMVRMKKLETTKIICPACRLDYEAQQFEWWFIGFMPKYIITGSQIKQWIKLQETNRASHPQIRLNE